MNDAAQDPRHRPEPPSRAPSPALLPALLVACPFLITLFIAGLVAFSTTQGRLHCQQQAQLETENLSRLLQQHIANTIDRTDVSLRTVGLEIERQFAHGGMAPAMLDKFIAQQESLQTDIDSLRATDADGIVRYGPSVPPHSSISVADRAYFIRARDGKQPELLVDGPIISRITQKPTMVFARRLTRPDGSFAGVVYANIATEHFQKMLASPNLGVHGAATLRTGDLRLIARQMTTSEPDSFGSRTVSDQLLAQLKANPVQGAYVAPTTLDRVERSNAYRQVAPYPLYVIVGLATEDYLSGWREQARRFAALGALAIAIVCLSSCFVYLAWKRQDQAVKALAQQQEIVRQAGSYNRSLIEASLDLLVTIGTDGRIADVNTATERMTGHSRQALIGTEFAACFVDAEEARAAHQRAFRDETVRDLRLEIRHADGKTATPVLYNASLYRNESGAIGGVFAAARDVSQLQEAEQAKERITRALRLLSAGNELLVHANDEQALLDDLCRLIVDTGGYRMAWVGYAEQDAEKSVRPVAQAGDDAGYLRSARISWADTALGRGPTGTAIRAGTTQVNQNCLTDARMAPWREAAIARSFQSSMALALLSENRTLGALTLYSADPDAFGADEVNLLEELADNFAYGIETLRLRATKAAAEKELDGHRRNLEALVAQRTAELAAAKIEAERANDAKSRFLAAASHDLRQPLSALSLYVGALSNKLAPADGRLLANMKDCVANLSEMLTGLLDLSKLDAGVVTPEVGDFALDALLAQLASAHAPDAARKGLAFRYSGSGLIGRSDPVLFGRIVGNLVANAIRYTERGGVLVGCRRRAGKRWVEIWDTGIGIPADKTSEIFEEFKQLGNQERDRTKGTGLGLAIVARTAALLGLEIRVRSRPGKGSLFAVELPPGEAVSPRRPPQYAHRPLSIALVEDNAEVAAALTYALTDIGHRVVSAPSEAEILPGLKGVPPDIVISDYRLAGGKTGFDVIAALRAAFGGDLQAIVITGDTDPAVIRRMAKKQISVLNKPLNLDALRGKIAELTA